MGTTNLANDALFYAKSGLEYSAKDLRRFLSIGREQGVIAAGDFAVSERGAGANLSVDVDPGEALIQGDTSTDQGLYYVNETATTNVSITAADATNPRIDRVVLEILDHDEDAGGSYFARIRVVDGTPTSGATLVNLTGAATVPDDALLLANVSVPALDTTISDAQIDTTVNSVRVLSRGPNNVYAARMYAANSGSPTHNSTGNYQKVGSGGGTLTWTSAFDIRPAGVSAQVDTATNKRLDIRRAGLYRVGIGVGGNPGIDKYLAAAVYKNGALAEGPFNIFPSPISQSLVVGASSIVNLSVGDYLEPYASQNTGGSMSYFVTGSYATFIEFEYLGPSS
jgi:hypothetical protein